MLLAYEYISYSRESGLHLFCQNFGLLTPSVIEIKKHVLHTATLHLRNNRAKKAGKTLIVRQGIFHLKCDEDVVDASSLRR